MQRDLEARELQVIVHYDPSFVLQTESSLEIILTECLRRNWTVSQVKTPKFGLRSRRPEP